MAFSGILQISLVSKREWTSLYSRVENESRRVSGVMSGMYRQSSMAASIVSVQKIKEL
jgi:hypothetical protein